MASIKEVAKHAGVSISSVSRVMNHSKAVSDELRERVMQAVWELDYSPNTIARSLKSVSTKTIAVIITSVARTFFVPILDGISQEARKHGYIVQIMQTQDSLEEEIQLVNLAASQWIDGVILASSAYGDSEAARNYISHLDTLEKRGQHIPVVSLEYAFDDSQVDAIVVDHYSAAYSAVCHLIRDAGRKYIAHISLPEGHYMGERRKSGYLQALKDNGLEIKNELIALGDYSLNSGRAAAKALIDSGVCFDAIFCANDEMALGAMQACSDAGISVPQRAAIMGYDDIITSALSRPSLSSVSVPKFEMGTLAVRRIIERMESPELPREIRVLDTSIITRESTTTLK